MHWIDASILIVYMIALVAIGVYFMRKNTDQEDYFVGGRGMGHWHIGLSVVATDVGGGFSIGLGGLGFVMGLSGAWMLFTGLVGAWLAAVFLIPRVYDLARREKLLCQLDAETLTAYFAEDQPLRLHGAGQCQQRARMPDEIQRDV